MKKKLLSLLLSVTMMCSMIPSSFAASSEAIDAASALHDRGLFNGVGTNADGTPNFDLDRTPTRHEAVTMLVAMLGKSSEAQAGNWTTPFTDVADWAKPFVGYAYTNGLTSGTSATTFGGNDLVSAAQYLTFVLKVLGYEAGTDFQWNTAWELSDKIGLTKGEYNEKTRNFTRGDVAIISNNALSVRMKGTDISLGEYLKAEGLPATKPEEAVKPVEPSKPVPETYTVNGIPYPGKLGEPVLGKAAAELALTATPDVAAQKINNVGDAIYYMQALPRMDQPSDTCKLFAQLVGGDYDEVGLIHLTRPDNGYVVAYIKQSGVYYPLDLFSTCKGQISWIVDAGCSKGTDLNVLCNKLMSTFPYNPQKTPMTEWWSEVTATYQAAEEKKLIAYLTTPQYTKEQMNQWVAEGLTLEQWAEKIKVPADAIQMLNALNYRDVEYNDNVTFYDSTDTEWGSTWNAKTVFDHRSGNCGGTSNIINTLFADDFDQQGYVEFNSANGGHIFNYFVSDGVYVFCDFVGIPGPYSLGGEQVCPPDTPWFVVYTTSSPEEFGDWYRNKGFFSKEFDDPNQEAYLYQLFMYPCDGVKHPKGRDSHSEQTKFNNSIWDVLPEQYKDDYTILYEREGYPIRFHSISSPSTWPAEIR